VRSTRCHTGASWSLQSMKRHFIRGPFRQKTGPDGLVLCPVS
jgi:hypothetical protein